jgi:1,4-dihydroxy-2-naphthoate octaprenyltransferase
MGAGLAQYVRTLSSSMALLSGGVFLVLALLSFDYLLALQQMNDPKYQDPDQPEDERRRVRLAYGAIAAALITVAVTVFVGWLINGLLWQGITLLLIAFFAVGGLVVYAGMKGKWRPFQPLFETLLVVVIPPAMGFFLQTEQMHSFLTLIVLGPVPLYLAFSLLTQLIHFGEDQQWERQTTVTEMGWEPAMVLHNALILLGYVLLALGNLLGLPWFLVWPVFLTLPLGLVEIWLMERTRRGQKPLWRIMQFAMGSTFVIPVYLLAFAFWLR